MQTIEELQQHVEQYVAQHRQGSGPELIDLSDHDLVFVYLRQFSPEQRREKLAQPGALGDRLRQAWNNYVEWLEKNRDYLFKRHEARRKRAIRRLLRQGQPIPEELQSNPYAR